MTDDKIISRVYEELWELFKDCPRYQKALNHANALRAKGSPEINKPLKHFDIWTILGKILPDCIDIIHDPEDDWVEAEFNYHKSREGGHRIEYDDPNDDNYLHLNSKWHDNIWQSILSLLEAIKSHPDRDKMKFVWGKEKS